MRCRSLSLALAIAAVAPVAAAAGCKGSGDSPDAMPPQSCIDAETHSDLDWLEQNVFYPSCSKFTSCHKGSATEAGELNLEPGMVEQDTVNVPAMIDKNPIDGLDIVEPGDPMHSYMLIILGQYGTDDPRIVDSVGTMPYNNPLLCHQKRDAIQRWIESL